MNDYSDSRITEAKGLEILRPFIEEKSIGFVWIDKGRAAKVLQETLGDLIFTGKQDWRLHTVEIKTERRHTGNLFLETWSNRNLDNIDSHIERGSNPGWLLKLRADILLYYFIDSDTGYALDLLALKRWAFGCGEKQGRIYDFPELRQGKCQQKNDTHGRIVPVSVLMAELKPAPKTFRPKQLALQLGEASEW